MIMKNKSISSAPVYRVQVYYCLEWCIMLVTSDINEAKDYANMIVARGRGDKVCITKEVKKTSFVSF